ncbi:MAG: DUF4445 domain-containing protein [Planctomycetes bacterium]|nr:DUF4445 domain-containing protein [Planctomycetota bacterium]
MRGYKVYFSTADKLVTAQPGENLLALARRVGVHLDSSCGGNGSCKQCRVRVCTGPYPKQMIMSDPRRFVQADNGSPAPPNETVGGEPLYLACRGCVMGDLVVEAVPRVQQARTLVRKQLKGMKVPVDRPDLPADALVAAVDMGSTTIAGYLVDLQSGEIIAQSSRENSQIPYGGDILTRVSHTERYPDGLETLKKLARQDLAAVLELLRKQAGARKVMSIAVCGNSVIQSLLMSWDVLRLGSHPFEPVSVAPQVLKGRDLDLSSFTDVETYVMPMEAGFIGGDNVAAILAAGLDEFEGVALLMDIGTNAEIVVGGKNGLLVGSTPTGPAFEGGAISFGMRAARGAIDTVDWVPANTRTVISTIGNIPPVGICGSGIIDTVAALWRSGMIDQDGKMLESRFTRMNAEGMREVVLVGTKQEAVTPEGVIMKAEKDIVFSQKDLRELQLAKAALATGAEIMVKKIGRLPDKLILAGGFGSYLDVESAVAIGLIPNLPRERIEVAGNSAGLGVAMAAASLKERARAERIARATKHIPLPDEPEFQDLLLANIAFPTLQEPPPELPKT